MTNAHGKQQIVTQLDALVRQGTELLNNFNQSQAGLVLAEYQQWYSRTLSVIRTLMPERELDFRRFYDRDPNRRTLSVSTYSLEDYVQAIGPGRLADGTRKFNPHAIAKARFLNQLTMVQAARERLDDLLANLRGVLQADLFDSELDAAKHLKDNGHLRAGGAIAGVVLESHLAEVCNRRVIVVRKKNPGISDFNDALKNAGIIDLLQWRGIQHLADIRNYCDHKKSREPTAEEVDELVDGVNKITKKLS